MQTADGALNEVHDMLQRMNELAVKSANGTLSDTDRGFINNEVRQLKSEIDRVFETTTYNERLIWDPDTPYKTQIGTKREAVTQRGGSGISYEITDDNCGIVPNGSIKFSADKTNGIRASWTGYDGVTYTTDYMNVDWDSLAGNDFSFKLSDLYPAYDPVNNPSSTKFYDSTGKALIDNTFSFSSHKYASVDDIISCVNGAYASNSASVSASASDSTQGALKITSASLEYWAAYKSYASNGSNHYDFDADINDSITPASGTANVTHPSYNPATAASDSGSWTIKLDMVGVGPVTGKLTGISYSSQDHTPEAYNTWWHTYKFANGTIREYQTAKTSSDYTLKGIVDIMQGDYGDPSLAGLLSKANGGSTDGSSGEYSLTFTLTDSGGNKVGSISYKQNITGSTTLQDVLDALDDAFNDTTVIDMNPRSNVGDRGGYVSSMYLNSRDFDAPIFKATNRLRLQAGTEAGQYIDLDYDSLSIYVLGMQNTRVDTQANAGKAIDEIKAALEVVSGQRADFGAYQNRLEHTVNNLNNIVENDASAESKIRDTDMAKYMVEFSNFNILQQVGQSMLASANQSREMVLSLLP